MGFNFGETDCDSTKSVDLLTLTGGITLPLLVVWRAAITTVGAGAAAFVEGTATDPSGGANTLSASNGATMTLDGSSLSVKTGMWIVQQDATNPFTFDVGYTSPFNDMRFTFEGTVNIAPGY